MSTTFFDDLVEQGEQQYQKWLFGSLSRQLVPASERFDYAIAVIYAGGSLAAGFIETEAKILANAKRIYDTIVAAAETGGFKDADMLALYFKRERWTSGAAEIAADMVDCIGGPEAFIDLFDLAARTPETMGGIQ